MIQYIGIYFLIGLAFSGVFTGLCLGLKIDTPMSREIPHDDPRRLVALTIVWPLIVAYLLIMLIAAVIESIIEN